MKTHSKAVAALCASLIGGSFAAGCGAEQAGDIEVVRGAIVTVQPWQPELGGKTFDYFGPSFLTKRVDGVGFTFWALTSHTDNVIYRNPNTGSWLGWGGPGGTTSNVASKLGTTQWVGPGGVTSRNAAIAYVSSSGAIKVGVALNQEGSVSSWTSLSTSGLTSIATVQPALAYTNGFLYVFVHGSKTGSADQVFFKRNPAGSNSYNPANWDTNWTMIPKPNGFGGNAIANDVAAAAISGTKISVMAAGIDGSNECLISTHTVNANSTTVGGWQVLQGGCQLSSWSTVAMTPLGSTYQSGAAIVFRTTSNGMTIGKTTDGSNITSLTNIPNEAGKCGTFNANPGIVQTTSGATNRIVFGTTCDGGQNLDWRFIDMS